ncbi:MAG: hypothetical protein QOD30_325, partial [Actinomycetota bacterium]|nr:hypothetical protein [Actinomycetota bacterium]
RPFGASRSALPSRPMTCRRGSAVLLAAALVLAITSSACGDDDDATGRTTTTTSSTASTSTTASTTTTVFAGSTSPTSIPSHASATALLTDVDVGTGVVTFAFRSDTPGLDVRYVEPPITQDASGEEVDVRGAAFLQVRMEPASGVDLSEDPFEETYTGPDRVDGTEPITEIVKTGDFEANLTWVIGMSSMRPYRVEVAASIVRVYVST